MMNWADDFMSLGVILTVVFIVFKLLGIVTWSSVWIFAPVIVASILSLVLFILWIMS